MVVVRCLPRIRSTAWKSLRFTIAASTAPAEVEEKE